MQGQNVIVFQSWWCFKEYFSFYWRGWTLRQNNFKIRLSRLFVRVFTCINCLSRSACVHLHSFVWEGANIQFTIRTLLVNEKPLFSYPSSFHHSNRPKTSHLNILKIVDLSIHPPDLSHHYSLSASYKYSGTAVYYTVWLHPPSNIHIFDSREEKHIGATCVTHDSHFVWSVYGFLLIFFKRETRLQQ